MLDIKNCMDSEQNKALLRLYKYIILFNEDLLLIKKNDLGLLQYETYQEEPPTILIKGWK